MTTGTAKLRRHNEVTPAEWQLLEEEGYVRLGVVLTEAEIDWLCQCIDQIMWGTIRYPGMKIQLW